MRLHIGKALNSLKPTDYLEEEEEATVQMSSATPDLLLLQ